MVGWWRDAARLGAQAFPAVARRVSRGSRDGVQRLQVPGGILSMPYLLALKADALHLTGRTREALEALNGAETLAERSEERWCCAELHRLRGVFLAAIGADETQN